MFIRAVLVWLIILVLAILNGAFRQGLLIPRFGEPVGRVLSPIILAVLVLVAAWILLPWIQPHTQRDAWLVGVLWLVLTLAFEFLAGHYLFGDPWERLLAEYNVARGRFWVLVPITTLLAPIVIQTLRSPAS
jgi:hypothetical protein